MDIFEFFRLVKLSLKLETMVKAKVEDETIIFSTKDYNYVVRPTRRIGHRWEMMKQLREDTELYAVLEGFNPWEFVDYCKYDKDVIHLVREAGIATK